MENNHSYRSSSMGNKAVSHKPTSEEYSSDHEESGWTAYFQDFNNNNNNNIDIKDHENYHENILEESFCTISSSLVSDAASYAAWKIDHDQTPKKLSFKKTRAKEISGDDSLEDTASSPVNSPKVGDLKPVDHMKYKETYDLIDDSQGKRGTSGYYSEVQPEERKIVDFDGKNDCLDLKKRGLCLVPLSMPFNRGGQKTQKRTAIGRPLHVQEHLRQVMMQYREESCTALFETFS